MCLSIEKAAGECSLQPFHREVKLNEEQKKQSEIKNRGWIGDGKYPERLERERKIII